jgi:hypothetical protein
MRTGHFLGLVIAAIVVGDVALSMGGISAEVIHPTQSVTMLSLLDIGPHGVDDSKLVGGVNCRCVRYYERAGQEESKCPDDPNVSGTCADVKVSCELAAAQETAILNPGENHESAMECTMGGCLEIPLVLSDQECAEVTIPGS